jgi:hypothetical protein
MIAVIYTNILKKEILYLKLDLYKTALDNARAVSI